MAFYKEDIVDIELQSGTIHRSFLNHSIGSGDDDANRFGVRAFRNGVAENIGGSCTGYFIRTDGATVVITGGVVSGNVAYVTLPETCYAVEGVFSLAIKCSGGGVTGTLRIVDGVVSRTTTSALVDPGTILPSIEDLIDDIEAAVASIPADYSDLWETFAGEFSSDKQYSAGQYTTYDGKMYKFITTHTGTWNASHVVEANVAVELYQGNRKQNDTLYVTMSPHGEAFSTLSIGEYKSLTTGSTINNAKMARSNTLNVTKRRAVGMTNANYLYSVVGYSNAAGTSDYFVKCLTNGWISANNITPVSYDTPVIVVQVKRVDGADISSSEESTIKSAFVFYTLTDDTLTVAGAPADADAAGKRIRNLIATAVTKEGPSFSTLELGAVRDFSTGAKSTGVSDCASSISLAIQKRKAVTFTNTNYQFSVLAFSDTPIGSSNYLGVLSGGWVEAGDIVTTASDTVVISVQVRKKDGTAIQDSEKETIISGFKFYTLTDDTLTGAGVPADAKAVGDAIQSIGASFYRTNDAVSLVTDASDVYALFDALVTDHSDFVTKNTLTSGSFTNYEYVFTIGNYNSQSGQREQDSEIEKPVILITSGVHGYERSSVLSLYTFCKALCENEYSLAGIIEDAVYKVIPVVCPWGYTNDSRINANGVNINRNFASSSWEETETGSNYSGAEPGDQDETKVVQNWINANTDAAFIVDWHNSSYTDEISCLLGGISSDEMTFKKKYLLGINAIIPYWMKAREIDSTNIYAYTGNTTTGGTLKSYAQDKELLAFTLETSWNVISTGKHSNFSIGTGAEAFGNMMIGLKSYMEDI